MQGGWTTSGVFVSLLALVAYGAGLRADMAWGQQIRYQLDYATYFGGSHGEGNVVFCTGRRSLDPPTTPGA